MNFTAAEVIGGLFLLSVQPPTSKEALTYFVPPKFRLSPVDNLFQKYLSFYCFYETLREDLLLKCIFFTNREYLRIFC